MKTATAISILTKEQEVLGIGLLELLVDIRKEGEMVYSPEVMQAFRVFMAEGTKLFA